MPSHLLPLLRAWHLAERAKEYSTARYLLTELFEAMERIVEEEKRKEKAA
jgi:hypothetical protein